VLSALLQEIDLQGAKGKSGVTINDMINLSEAIASLSSHYIAFPLIRNLNFTFELVEVNRFSPKKTF